MRCVSNSTLPLTLIALASLANAANACDVTLQTLETKNEAIHHLGRSLAVRNQTREDGPVLFVSGCEVGWRSAVLVFDARLRKTLRAVAVFPSAPSFGAALEWNRDELWIGSPNANGGAGTVFVCPDVLGERARELDAFPGASGFGRTICANDPSEPLATRRVLVGAPMTPNGALKNCGGVAAYDARDATPCWSLVGECANERLGSAIEELDDLDGDGVPDFALGAPGDVAGGASATVGRVILVSGASGAFLRACIPASDPYRGFGFSLASIADLDGDGKRDLAIGAPLSTIGCRATGLVSIVSTRTGVELSRLGPESRSIGDREWGDAHFGWTMVCARTELAEFPECLTIGAPNGRPDECELCGCARSWLVKPLRAIDDGFGWARPGDDGFAPQRFGAVMASSRDRSAAYDVVAIGTDDEEEHGGFQVFAPRRSQPLEWVVFGASHL